MTELATLAGATRARDRRGAARDSALPEREVKMRAAQLWHWIYHRGAARFRRDAQRRPADAASRLAERFTLERPEIVAEQVSADGTRKWLLRMAADRAASTKARKSNASTSRRRIAARSASPSQVGCTLNCTFCHTGTQKLVRNLTAAEIVAQVMVARDRLGDFPGGIAPTDGLRSFAARACAPSPTSSSWGMGEPLYNFEAVRDAIAVLTDGEGLSLSKRRITVSTSGVVPRDASGSAQECGTMLAISLHATNDALRDKLVPLNQKYPIEDAARRPAATIPAPPTRGASPSNM